MGKRKFWPEMTESAFLMVGLPPGWFSIFKLFSNFLNQFLRDHHHKIIFFLIFFIFFLFFLIFSSFFSLAANFGAAKFWAANFWAAKFWAAYFGAANFALPSQICKRGVFSTMQIKNK
jgi:hypothetical protein